MIKLELTVEEVNMILRVLGQHPFVEVANLVSKIKGQGDPQVEELIKQAEAAKGEQPAA